MKKLKYIFHLLICILVSFVLIYLLVFFGGWKLIESGDIILIEIAVSVVVGIILFVIYEISCVIKVDIKNLQNQIEKLQKEIDNLNKSKQKDIK